MEAVSTNSTLSFITDFISQWLIAIMHHHNQLRHYRNTKTSFRKNLNTLMDIDFSENLQVPVRFEPQSLHWSHPQITVHSGLMKFNGQKTYHPYTSSEKKYDHVFVKVAIKEMLAEIDIKQRITVIIQKDNCTFQYKSCAHF